ncbi:MAG: guanylate kinase [Candidatus Eisenbacteria bacterium]|nr:guanylate kinase [Candidatus Eisenbacteria bacterium]
MVETKSSFPIVIAGPSGAGKTTLARAAAARDPRLRFSISDTSRPIREGEADGRDYRFVGEEEFEERIRAGRYAEWAKVHGDYYGTPRSEIEEGIARGEDVVLDIDVQGCEQVRAKYSAALAIFIVPPSLAVLEKRLRERRTEPEERIRTRLENARAEIEKKFEYDYIVVNDRLDGAIETVLSIIRAERCRAARLRETAGAR